MSRQWSVASTERRNLPDTHTHTDTHKYTLNTTKPTTLSLSCAHTYAATYPLFHTCPCFVSCSCAFPHLLTSFSPVLSSLASQSSPLLFHCLLHLPFPLTSTHIPLSSPAAPDWGLFILTALLFWCLLFFFYRHIYPITKLLHPSIHSSLPSLPYFISVYFLSPCPVMLSFFPLLILLLSPLSLTPQLYHSSLPSGIGLRWLIEAFG